MRTTKRLLMAVAMTAALCGNATSQPTPGGNAILVAFGPDDGSTLVEGGTTEVFATVEMTSSQTDRVEFTGELSVNGQSFTPFQTVYTPGEISAKERSTWFVLNEGKTLRARFSLMGKDTVTGVQTLYASVTRTYRVKCNPKQFWLFRAFHRLLGCCEN